MTTEQSVLHVIRRKDLVALYLFTVLHYLTQYGLHHSSFPVLLFADWIVSAAAGFLGSFALVTGATKVIRSSIIIIRASNIDSVQSSLERLFLRSVCLMIIQQFHT